jgi:4-amino-4-deoxy-L-arabinose transferase-like glycosyltransferase
MKSIQEMLKSKYVGLFSTLVLALFTRLLGISSRPIWYDEAFSILFSEKGIAAMLKGTLAPTGSGTADIHPLTYYSILMEWMRGFGESIIAARLLSILFGLGVVALVYIIANELFNTRTALISGAIAAFAPFQIFYSQEIRMYSLLALFLLLATYTYWRASRSGHWLWWMGFSIFAAGSQYTHNLAAFYLIALALWPLITKDWRPLKSVTLAGIFSVLLYLPWLVYLPAQFAKVNQAYWIDKPGFYRLFTLLLYFITNLPLPKAWLVVGLFIALFAVAIGVWQTIRAAREKLNDSHNGLWMFYLAFMPPLLLFLFSQWKPIYLERALLPSGAVFCIWLAWALTETKLPKPIQGFAALLLLIGFGMGIYQNINYAGFPYAPYQAMTQSLQAKLQPGDVIIHSSKLSMLPSVYYDRTLPQTYAADPPGSSVDTLAPATQQVLGLEAQPDIASAVGDAKRVWFVIFDQSNQEYIQAGYPRHPQLTWLMENYSQIEIEHWGDLQVYLFSKTQ